MGTSCSRPKSIKVKNSSSMQLPFYSTDKIPQHHDDTERLQNNHQKFPDEPNSSRLGDNSKITENSENTSNGIKLTHLKSKLDDDGTEKASNQNRDADYENRGSDGTSEQNENRQETVDSEKSKEETEDESEENIETALETFRVKALGDMESGEQALTSDEIDAVSKLVVRRVKRAIREVDVWKESNGEYSQSALLLLSVFDEVYTYLLRLKASIEVVVENRKSVANQALNTGIIEKICETVNEIYRDHGVPDWTASALWTPLFLSLGVLWNYTDTSEEWTERARDTPGFLDTLCKILEDIKTMENMHTEEEKYVLLAVLGITHNISMVDSNIAALRDKNFTEALQPHLKSASKDEHLAALSSLAGIINEEESEVINSNKKVVKHLMRVLKGGLKTEERRYDGWTCRESALTIRMLGRNDANKKLLVRLGALPLLVQLATGNTQEKIEAVNAIWVLSFDAENRKIMVHTDGLGVIESVCELRQSTNEKIRKAANGTLWNLRDELRMSEKQKYQDIGKQITPASENSWNESTKTTKSKPDQGEGHIMISYQWSNQKTLLNIRNELQKYGLKVWMDVDNMAGSTLQAMAEAIENADIVLLCYCQKYKISPNCRAEAEYSFLRQKNIIPLRMERDYKPDGWLGILIGAKLFFDFSGKYEFKDKFNRLLVEVKRIKGENRSPVVPKAIKPLLRPSDAPDGAILQIHHDLQAPPTETVSSHINDPVCLVRSWTSDDIKNWIIKQNLPKQPFCKFTVDEIVLLLNMRREAPESFYTYLDKLLKSNFRVIAQLVRALEEIGK